LVQLVRPLAELGVALEVRSFLGASGFKSLYSGNRAQAALALAQGFSRRAPDLLRARRADVLLVQREAALIGPPVFEALVRTRRPFVLDLDDPTWTPYDSPTYGRMARLLKWPGKTDWLIRHAALVTCGSHAVAQHAEALGAKARLVPTVVDTDVFRPDRRENEVPVIGWIGTHSTFPYLQSVVPALRAVARRRRFRLLVVGAGDVCLDVPGAEVEIRDWSLHREVADFQSFDIGLYPLVDDGWAPGKSGFKAIQYLAVGVPYVVTPLGETREIGTAGETHLEARALTDWEQAIDRLLDDADLRRRMGMAGRAYSESHYAVDSVAASLAAALAEAAA
jgi:glycosyltransferase involved in cell wall biosynthesis